MINVFLIKNLLFNIVGHNIEKFCQVRLKIYIYIYIHYCYKQMIARLKPNQDCGGYGILLTA